MTEYGKVIKINMEDKRPLVSIIVPVYNVEKYLEACLESILNQEYNNFELILVDDGSCDSSSLICDRYEKNNAQIIVVHKENKGLSDARNVGISISKGKYLTFIDSDDCISKNYISLLVEYAEKYSVDIVQAQWTNNANNLDRKKSERVRLLSRDEALEHLFLFKEVHVMACCKLYRRELFEKVLFPVGRIHEDNFTTYRLLYYARGMCCIPDVIYYYRINESGIMKSPISEKNFKLLCIKDEMMIFFDELFPDYIDEVEYYYMRLVIRLYNECIMQQKEKEYKDYVERMVLILKRTSIKNPYLENKYKILLIILRFSSKLYRKIVCLFRKRK